MGKKDDALEDQQDVETIRQRLAEGGDTVPWEDIKAEMDAEAFQIPREAGRAALVAKGGTP